MPRKRSQYHPQKNTKKTRNLMLYLSIIAIIIIVVISALILVKDPSENTNNNSTDVDEGTWFFAMDTSTEYVGGNQEYNTGYIPTLIIIDIDGNIVHKSAGVHLKDELIELVEEAEKSSTVRESAPDFTLELINGGQFTLSDYKGTPVILDLMAVRCPPCKDQMPELQKVDKELGDDVIILSIDVDGAVGYETTQDVINAFGEYIKE